VKNNAETHYLWCAANHEGEVLESFVTIRHDPKAALRFLKKLMNRYRQPKAIVTNRLRSYRAAMYQLGNVNHLVTGWRLNNRAENSHLPFRRRERPMQRFRLAQSLQKFTSIHSSVENRFNQQRHLISRVDYKSKRKAALIEWQQLFAA